MVRPPAAVRNAAACLAVGRARASRQGPIGAATARPPSSNPSARRGANPLRRKAHALAAAQPADRPRPDLREEF